MEANYVNPHSVINIAHSGGIKGRNNGNRYTMQGREGGGVTHMNNAGLKCKDANVGCAATEEKIKSCTSGSGIVRTRPPRDEAIIKVGIVCH